MLRASCDTCNNICLYVQRYSKELDLKWSSHWSLVVVKAKNCRLEKKRGVGGKGKGRRPEEEQEGLSRRQQGRMEGMTASGLNVTFTIQLFMHGKEVGSLVRKNRESVKKMCGESVVHINIITLAGPMNAIFKAFAMITDALGEDVSTTAQLPADPGHPQPGGPC